MKSLAILAFVVAFGAAKALTNPLFYVKLAILGLALAYMREKSGSLWPPIAAQLRWQ